MHNFNNLKKLKKQMDREETIKHYVLGYILECMQRNNVNVTVSIRRFLVYDLKVLDEQVFISCLKIARMHNLFDNMVTSEQHKKVKQNIKLSVMSEEEQLEIIKRLRTFANNYDGVFVNSNIANVNYEKVKKTL